MTDLERQINEISERMQPTIDDLELVARHEAKAKRAKLRRLALYSMLVLACFLGYVSHLMTYTAPGIIAVPGFQHGVAFCGVEYGVVAYTEDNEFWHDKERDITYVVNEGHINDEEVNNLVLTAQVECAKLAKEKKQ